LDSSFPLLKAAYKCTKNLYEGKQPSWYGSVQQILQNMPSLTNFLTDKTSEVGKMNPNFQVYAKILKFALIYRNEEGTGLVLTTAKLVLFLCTPKRNLQNFKCNFSQCSLEKIWSIGMFPFTGH
jgi:hypothetical protein